MRQKVSSYEEKKRFILYKGHTGWKIKTRIFGSLLVTFSAFAFAGNANIISVHAADTTPDATQQEKNVATPAPSSSTGTANQEKSATVANNEGATSEKNQGSEIGTIKEPTADTNKNTVEKENGDSGQKGSHDSEENVNSATEIPAKPENEEALKQGELPAAKSELIKSDVIQKKETPLETQVSQSTDQSSDAADTTTDKYPVLSQDKDVDIGTDSTQVELSADQIAGHFTATLENRGARPDDMDQDNDPTDNIHKIQIGADGTVSLTSNDSHQYYTSAGKSYPVNGHQVAHVSFEHEIDFSHNFDMTGALGIGSKSGQNAADSVGFVFAPGNPATATQGGSGGQLGIGGLKKAFGFVYDQYYNSDQNDPSSSPYFGWRTTDDYGNLQSASASEWANATALPKLNDRNTNPSNNFTMHYDADSKVLHVTLGGKTFDRTITDTSTGYSISVAASTGGSWNDYSAKIDSFSYTPKTINVGVNLVDGATADAGKGALLDGAKVKAVANIGDTISVFSTQEAANRAVKAGKVEPNLVTVIPEDKNGNVYVIDGQNVVENNNGQAHYIDGTKDDIVGNTYYSYTVTDGADQSMTVPVKLAFTAKVTPVDSITKVPIAGLSPVTVVAVEGEKTLVQVPGYTPTAIVLSTPKTGQTIAEDTLPIDTAATDPDGTQTKEVANPIGHYYTGSGTTVDGQSVNSTATVGTGQSISSALENQKFTVNSGGKTPITSDDYYWSDSGNAASTDSTDADASQKSSSLLVPTNSTLQYWENQAATNEATAKDYQTQANNIYTQFTAISNLTSGQQTDAKNLLDEINSFYKNVSATNDSAKAAFASGQTSTVANDIYDYGQTGYAYLKKVENLLADFDADLKNYDKENKDAHSSLATFSSYNLTYGDEVVPPKDFSVGDGFGPITADQKATMNNPDYYQYYNLDGSGDGNIPKKAGQYIVKLTDAGRTQLKSLSTNPDKAGLYISPVLTINPKPISTVSVEKASVDYGGLKGGFPTFSTSLDSSLLDQSDYTVTDNSTNKTITNVKDLHVGGDYSISLNENGKEKLAGKMDANNKQVGGDTNYSIGGFTSGILKVNPKEITISAQLNGKIYGEKDPDFGLTADSVDGLVNGDKLSALGIALTRTDKNNNNVGEYQIIEDETKLIPNSNYSITFNPAPFNISPKTIIVSVNKPDTITYGQNPSPDLLSISAVDNDSNPIDVSAAKLTLEDFSVEGQDTNLAQTKLDATTGDGYTIELNASGKNKLANNCLNYVADDKKFGTNNLKVNKAPVNLDLTGSDINYGDTPNLKVSTEENIDLNGMSSLGTSDFTEKGNDTPVNFKTLNVGAHDLGLTKTALQTLQHNNPNYYVASVSGFLTVKAKPVTVAVKVNGNTEDSSVYGSSPKLQVIISDKNVTLQDTDLTTDDFTIIGKDSTDFNTLSVGDGYKIGLTATALNKLISDNPNYAIDLTNGKLTITPAKVTVKISSSSKYGMTPEFKIAVDPTVQPEVNVDDIKLDSKYFTAVKEPTTDFSDLDVGDYDVELNADGLKALDAARPNYDFISSSGVLSVNKVDVAVKITANDNNESIYGTIPVFTVSDSGNHKGLSDLDTIKLGEDDFVVKNQTSTKFETLDASAKDSSYEVMLNQKGIDALNNAKTNYNFISSSGNLTINPVPVRLSIINNGKIEYRKNITQKDINAGVSAGTRTSELTGTPTADDYQIIDDSTNKVVSSLADLKVGSYTIQLKPESLHEWQAENQNFTLNQKDLGKFTISAEPVKLNINTKSITYGETPLFDENTSGVENVGLMNQPTKGDYEVVDSNGNVVSADNLNRLQAGNYTVKLKKASLARMAADNPNYTFDNESTGILGIPLTVKKRPVTITVTPQTKYTNEADPTNSSTVTDGDLKNGDSLKLAYTEPTSSNVGTYDINAESGNPNYDVTVVPGKLVVLGKTVDKDGNTTTTQKDENGKVVNVKKSWNDGTKTDYQYDPKTGIQTFTESLNDKPVVTKTVQAAPEKIYLPDGNGAITVVNVTPDKPETPEIVHYGIDPDKDGRTSADEIMKYHTDPLVYNSRGGSTPAIGNGTIVKKNQNIATTTSTVNLYNNEGKLLDSRALGIDSCWFSDEEYTIGGIMYYRVATDEFAKASDVYVYIDPEPALVRVYNNIRGKLVDYQGTKVNRELSPSSEWRTDRIAIINGQQFYRVATNEFVSVDEVYPYTNVNAEVTTNSELPIYNERDEKLDIVLPANGTYKADKIVVMNGVKFYRVATNQFIPVAGVRNYANVDFNVTTDAVTATYNEQGVLLNSKLPANATYKVDREIFVNGSHYYRVATNMFVKVKRF